MHRVNPIPQRHRQDQRHHNHQRGKDIQQRAQQQQQDIEQDQEGNLALNVCLDQFKQLLRHTGIHQVIRESLRHRQNQQNTAHHDHGIAHDGR